MAQLMLASLLEPQNPSFKHLHARLNPEAFIDGMSLHHMHIQPDVIISRAIASVCETNDR